VGRVIGASKILRDISSRKRIEQSLLQAEKIAATGRMAATIAHEINNPLESVMNLLYLLRDKKLTTKGSVIWPWRKANSDAWRISPSKRLDTIASMPRRALTSLSDIAEHALTIYEPRCTAAALLSGDHRSLDEDRASPGRDDASDL